MNTREHFMHAAAAVCVRVFVPISSALMLASPDGNARIKFVISDKPASNRIALRAERTGLVRLSVLLLGILLPQVLLLGPALVGARLLLPLDLLDDFAGLPHRPEFSDITPYDVILSDLVVVGEPSRVRLGRELRNGRFGLANPYCYCGGPAPMEPKLSLATLFSCVFPSPVALAWLQVLTVTLAGTGMYLFVRQIPGVTFWAACGVAWCYPVTGFFVFWQGYGLEFAAAWFPLLMLSVWNVVRSGRPGWWLLLILASMQLVVTRLDLAGHALLAGGAWGVFLILTRYGILSQAMILPTLRLGSAWAIAFAVAAPQVLHSLDYAKTGVRTQERAEGVEERPPIGLRAAPLFVSPYSLGSTHRGSLFLLPSNIPETAAGYSGLVVVLALAPLGFADPRQRRLMCFFLALSIVGAAWLLNLPLFVSVMRLPVLNLFSHNRFTFVTTFALFTAAALGLNSLLTRQVGRSVFISLALLGAWALWSAASSFSIPGDAERILTATTDAANTDAARLEALRKFDVGWTRISDANLLATGWSFTAFVLLLAVALRPESGPIAGGLLTMVALVELTHVASTARTLHDPQLYYPRLAVLDRIDRSPNQRVISIGCLPPRLMEMHGLRDIRGYDAVDPRLLVELLELGRDPRFQSPSYAKTFSFVPRGKPTPSGDMLLHPVLSLLGVTQVVTRAPLSGGFKPVDEAEGFHVYRNAGAASRAFVPRLVRQAGPNDVLRRLADWAFDPREVAYVDGGDVPHAGEGDAEVVADGSNFVHLRCQMRRAGLVVISDLWDAGWQAQIEGSTLSVLRVNHALRGVVVPQGEHDLLLTYSPAGVERGMWACAAGLAAAMIIASGLYWTGRRGLRASQPVNVA